MLAAALLARTGATMVGLSMGFVAYEQTASAFTVAFVAASFGLAFAPPASSPAMCWRAWGCERCSSAPSRRNSRARSRSPA
jgi:hypothetical protein